MASKFLFIRTIGDSHSVTSSNLKNVSKILGNPGAKHLTLSVLVILGDKKELGKDLMNKPKTKKDNQKSDGHLFGTVRDFLYFEDHLLPTILSIFNARLKTKALY